MELPAPPQIVFPHVERLEAYPEWMRLVHEVEAVAEQPRPAWEVELRARVGPFARSKRLRMERTQHEVDRLAVFERAEVDGRQHAAWTLRAELEPLGESSTKMTMHLAYDGGAVVRCRARSRARRRDQAGTRARLVHVVADRDGVNSSSGSPSKP